MRAIRDMHELRLVIQELETLKRDQAYELKLQIHETLESLKPVNIITSTLKQAIKTPDIRNGLLKTGLIFLAGKVFPAGALGRLLMGNTINWGANALTKMDGEDTSPIKKVIDRARDFIGDFLRKRNIGKDM